MFTIAFLVFLGALNLGQSEELNIIEIAEANGFTTLLALVKSAGLTEALEGEGPFTVFAPTNDAFENLPAYVVKELTDDPEMLKKVLLGHVVSGKVMSGDLTDGMEAESLQKGMELKFMIKDGMVKVNGAKVIKADVLASNGVIHVIDKVIRPASKNNIIDLANEKGFNALVALTAAVGLRDILEREGPFTVFAPTDEAFKSLSPKLMDMIKKNPYVLKKILLSHVVDGIHHAQSISNGLQLPSLNGDYMLKFSIKNGMAKVNGAKIIKADVEAANGVVHVIDRILNPFEDDSHESGENEPEPEPTK